MSTPNQKYCIKCKTHTAVKEGSAQIVTGKRGHPFEVTNCGVCNGRVSRYLKHDPTNPPTILPRAVFSASEDVNTTENPKVKKSRSKKKDKVQPAVNAGGVAASAVDAK